MQNIDVARLLLFCIFLTLCFSFYINQTINRQDIGTNIEGECIKNNKNMKPYKIQSLKNRASSISVDSEFERLDSNLMYSNEHDHSKKFDDGSLITVNRMQSAYQFNEKHPNQSCFIFKEYDENGFIKCKGLILSSDFSINMGVWYWFDSEGNIENVHNYEENYTYTLNDIEVFCKTKSVYLHYMTTCESDIKYARISRGYDDKFGCYAWYVSYDIADNSKCATYTLNGKTGKVLKEEISLIFEVD